MQFQYGGNPYPRSYCREKVDQDETKEDKGSKGMEDTNEGQRYRKLPRVYKFLLTVHLKLQPHGKTLKQTKRQEGLEMGRRTSESIQRT